MRCTTERLQFLNPGRGGKISRRKGEAKKNSQGEKYEMYHRTPSVFKSVKWWKNKRAHRNG
jgi:hypothetical protein